MPITNQQDIVDRIYTEIDSIIGDSIGNRVYDLEAPQDGTLPLCVFTIVADTPWLLFRDDGINMDVQIDIYHFKSFGIKTLRDINDALFADLHRAEISVDDITLTFKNTIKGIISYDEADPKIIRIRSEYNLR